MAALLAAGMSAPAVAADTFTVDVQVTGGAGTATGSGTFAPGDTVTLTATPDAGQVWEGWTSSQLHWIGARVGSFTMPSENVVITTSFRAEMPALKDVYADYFQVGNIWSGNNTYSAGSASSANIAKHYNVMTAENAMKPVEILPNNNIDPNTGAFTYRWGPSDTFVDQTLARGMKVHGHVLVWHGQSPARINSGATGGTRALAKENMRRYIEAVLTRYSGKIATWDVVNEAFVDSLTSFDPATQDWRAYLRGGPNGGQSNWYTAYANGADVAAGEGPADFLYDAFVFARQYGPETELQYNDFNIFESAGKAKAVIAMAKDLNAKYAQEHPDDPRPLVEAIGDQSHVYINQTPAFACSDVSQMGSLVNDAAAEWQPGACSNEASVERSIQHIVDAGFKVAISELDLQVWEAWNGQPEGSSTANYRDLTDPSVKDRISREGFTYWVGKITNRAELEAIQAQRFAEYFLVYKKYAEHIDRVTFWGLNDRVNWRATHNPLFLNSDWSEKLSAAAIADPEGWIARRGGDEGIPVEATVPGPSEPGVLTLTVADYGDSVVLEQASNAGDRIRFDGQLPQVTVTDSRNDQQAAGGAWAVTGSSTDFSNGAAVVTADHFGWAPRVEPPKPGVSAGAAVATALSGGPGLAQPQRLAEASPEGRFGSATLGADLYLEVPVDTAPGTYKGALTVSLFPVD